MGAPVRSRREDSAAMTVEGNITNNGPVTTTGNSQMLLDVPGIATATLLTNNGTMEAQNNSPITMAPGNSVSTGLLNHGVMEAIDDATVLVEASTSSFANDRDDRSGLERPGEGKLLRDQFGYHRGQRRFWHRFA